MRLAALLSLLLLTPATVFAHEAKVTAEGMSEEFATAEAMRGVPKGASVTERLQESRRWDIDPLLVHRHVQRLAGCGLGLHLLELLEGSEHVCSSHRLRLSGVLHPSLYELLSSVHSGVFLVRIHC